VLKGNAVYGSSHPGEAATAPDMREFLSTN